MENVNDICYALSKGQTGELTMENGFLDKLNPKQKEAAFTTEGYVRVIAGAGSGKTRALTARFAYLVNEIGILPSNILCVTFTNKAAGEMRARIRQLTGDNSAGYICTFHSFCVSVLSEDSHAVAYPQNFLVLDNEDINAMLSLIYEERGLSLRDMTYGQARDQVEIRKCLQEPDYYLDLIRMDAETLRGKYLAAESPEDILFYGYLYQQKKCFGLDYNDLINFTLYIFQEKPEIRLKWQERLSYILIDEFQDIDPLQYRLMQVLCGYHRNLFVVGDPDQTIYTWRGANVRYLLDFDNAFPGTRTVFLLDNYRSTPEILSVANALISKNRERIKKDLIPNRPSGQPVRYHNAKTAEQEAEWIAGEIRILLEFHVAPSDIAILYRAHFVSRSIEETLIRKEIPYAIYSGTSFFARKEVKDLLSYLHMLVYRDDLAFLRIVNVPRRNIGEKRIRFLQEYAAVHACSLFDALKQTVEDPIFRNTAAADFIRLVEEFTAITPDRPVSELISELLEESGYEEMLRTEGSQERLDNLSELKQSVYEYETTCGEEATLENYLSHIALFTNLDAGSKPESIRLMTVHAAKGLEFPYVFLAGLEDGVFPSRKVRDRQGMEEERRLAFVAVTRAESGLYLSGSGGRNHDGSPRIPSRFILDIGLDRMECSGYLPENLIREANERIRISDFLLSGPSVAQFCPGDRIRHSIMGDGTILSVDEKEGCYSIRFDELQTPRAITFRAKLSRIE